jgi:hypothetical protein
MLSFTSICVAGIANQPTSIPTPPPLLPWESGVGCGDEGVHILGVVASYRSGPVRGFEKICGTICES